MGKEEKNMRFSVKTVIDGVRVFTNFRDEQAAREFARVTNGEFIDRNTGFGRKLWEALQKG